MRNHTDEFQSPPAAIWKESRSQSVATLRKLTGETEKLTSEPDQQPEEVKGGLWIFGIPMIAVILLLLLLLQRVEYERQLEKISAAVMDQQVARSMDKIMSETSLLSVQLRASAPRTIPAPIPTQSAGEPKKSTNTEEKIAVHQAVITQPAQATAPVNLVPATAPTGSAGYAEQQMHLSDQLAAAGKLQESAAALLASVDSHTQDGQLRLAAIRAQMRIRNYTCAKQLAQGGMQNAASQSDYAMFERLLKTIPNPDR